MVGILRQRAGWSLRNERFVDLQSEPIDCKLAFACYFPQLQERVRAPMLKVAMKGLKNITFTSKASAVVVPLVGLDVTQLASRSV
jgi:hypothetical protein